jgi:RHS repeat-associated protein
MPFSTAAIVNAGKQPAIAATTQVRTTAHRDGELLVRFRTGTSQQSKDTVLATHGGRRKKQLRGESSVEKLELVAGQDPETAALQLRLNPEVEFVEPNFLIKRDDVDPSNPSFGEQWALRNNGQDGGQFGSDIHVSSAWQTTTGSQSATIAIIDSGIDFTHPDLANNQWTNPAPGTQGDVHGWDYTTDTSVIRDEQGHGTAIAGIIAAQGNNGIGISGVMWHASLMSLRVLDSTGSGDVADAIEAIDYAVAHHAEVINLSWGTTGNSMALKDAIERAIRRGVVVVCSAGNDGDDIGTTPYYPASFGSRDLIAVAATDNQDQLATWSNFGGQNVTIAAPGNNILTTQIGGGYGTVTGTSASAPLVTGVVGLMKSVNPGLATHKIVNILTDDARQVASLSGKVSSGGVVDASACIGDLQARPYQQNGRGNHGDGANDRDPRPSQTQVPAGLRPDNEGRGANGKEGSRGPVTAGLQGAPLANLPNLQQSRRVRTSVATASPSAPIHSNLMCADCNPQGGAGGSDPYFGTARKKPTNETGDPGVTLGSRNFNWSLPIVSLKGRGSLDLSIALYYNSLVWTKQGTAIQYNADHGTPAPGFQIGLPRLQSQYFNSDDGSYAYAMITPTGGRVQMKQVGTSGVYESSDSTYAQLTFLQSIPIVKTTDGTQYVFGTLVSGEWHCTKIEDRNGNYVSATYNISNGHLLTITDTLGRVVNFNYDGDNNLATIAQLWQGVSHTLATFIYKPVTISTNFTSLTSYGVGSSQTVLSYVAFAENTSYHFDYNSYGQVYQIRHKAPDGHELEHTWYQMNTGVAQTDCPRFTERHEYAQDWNDGLEAVTYYSVTNNTTWTNPETNVQQTGTLVQETAPDTTVYKEYSHASGWDSGMPQLTEYWSGAIRKKYVSTTWTQDNVALSYSQNPRVAEVNIYDDGGNRRRRTIEYNQGYSLPTHVREYSGANGQTFMRLTAIGYNLDAVYLNRRIIGLPYERVVYDGPTGNIVSRSINYYDWSDPYFSTQTPSTNYDAVGYPSSFIVGRGNLVAVQRFNCTNNTTAYDGNQIMWAELNAYNMAGAKVWTQDALGHRTSVSYSDSFSVAANNSLNTLAYPTQITDPEGNLATVEYNYDFGAVTRTHAPTSGTGAGTTYVDEVRTYDAYGRLEKAENQTNHAYVRFVYETNANYVHTYQTVIDLTQANELHSWEVTDGAGRLRAAAADHPGSSGGYTGQYTVFDNMGRAVQQSNPTEMNGSWVATGDDAAWLVTLQSYDWKGRPSQRTNTDGTQQTISYGGCGCAGGEVTTIQDEHGRQRRLTKDTLGRLATVEELNWSGSVYATTAYSYNARDQITQLNQAGQIRSFEYDGHGRLWHKTTPEQGTTTYSYNQDDTTNTVTDARGAKTVFTYNPRHLPTGITYDLSGVTSGQNVAATPNASFGYDAAGHRTSMSDGLGSATYNYNNLGQLTSEVRNFNSVGSYTLSYGYNLAGELSSITNPWGAQVGYNYDKAGRVIGVTGSGYAGVPTYASSLAYRAFGAIKGMSYNDGKALTTAYDNRLRPTTWNVAGVLGYNYNYDKLNEHTGRVTYAQSIQDGTLDRSYEYDQVGRLAISHAGAEARAHVGSGSWGTQDGPYSQGYDYDVWGNVTHKYGWGGEVQGGSPSASTDITYAYTGNRRNGFSYDAAGNLTNDLGQAFTYDGTGQQATASYSGYSLQQSYDGDGLRVKKSDNGAQTYYLRSSVLGGQVVAEIIWASVSWQWSRGYVYLGSQLLAVQQGGVYWMHEDPVTKSKRVTNSAGAVVSTVELDPWGADTNRSSNSAFQPKKFTSYDRDSNGTDEAMFRRYNRWQSRFDQPDPYDGSYELTNPQSFNRYAYVQGDPVNLVDPSGLDGEFTCTPGDPMCALGSVTVTGSFGGLFGAGGGGGRRELVAELPADGGGGGGGGGLGGGSPNAPSAPAQQRFGRKDKEERCRNAVAEAQRAHDAIEKRLGNAISAGGLDAGHQKAISESISQMNNAVKDIDKNCFDGPGGPPLIPELGKSLDYLRGKASGYKVPPVGWDGGRTQAEHRIKAAAFVGNIGASFSEILMWFVRLAAAH